MFLLLIFLLISWTYWKKFYQVHFESYSNKKVQLPQICGKFQMISALEEATFYICTDFQHHYYMFTLFERMLVKLDALKLSKLVIF